MSEKKQTSRPPDSRLGRTADRPYWLWMGSIFIRALHQVGAAVFLAVFLLPGHPQLPRMYLMLAAFVLAAFFAPAPKHIRHRRLF
jgi:hypothetical protein